MQIYSQWNSCRFRLKCTKYGSSLGILGDSGYFALSLCAIPPLLMATCNQVQKVSTYPTQFCLQKQTSPAFHLTDCCAHQTVQFVQEVASSQLCLKESNNAYTGINWNTNEPGWVRCATKTGGAPQKEKSVMLHISLISTLCHLSTSVTSRYDTLLLLPFTALCYLSTSPSNIYFEGLVTKF